MNWARLRFAPWLDTRAAFIARTPRNGTLLDLGSSDGETLRHMAELRPDLRFHAVDLAGIPEAYPPNCQFHRADLNEPRLPWPDRSMAAITCLHLVEHLRRLDPLIREVARLLTPGGRVYFETPHPRSLALPSSKGTAAEGFTMNFYDDPTHVKLVAMDELAALTRAAGLTVESAGISRNWLFAASHLGYRFRPASRQKFTAEVHWLGWSACLIARRPA